MGLLDTLKQIKEDGFNPETDRIATNSKLEAGKYAMRLKSAQTNTDKAGRAQIGIALEVTSGPQKDRTEILYISFDEGLPPFVLEKNGRTLLFQSTHSCRVRRFISRLLVHFGIISIHALV